MKIAVFEVEKWEEGAFYAFKTGHELFFSPHPITPQDADNNANADVLSTFIYSDLNAKMLSKFKKLKAIATRSTGYDHIDMEYCKKKGIQVSNVPAYGDNTVAEHVFGLILAMSHNLIDAVERTRRGEFSQQGLRGFDLRGKNLGVFGTGAIGRYVIEIAKGFKMNVIAFDVRPNDILSARLGFKYTTKEEVLKESDIITLHLPSNPATFHFLSTPEFDMMKKGVTIINTARGSLIDIQALLQAVASGKVGGVGLDVLPEEPTIREEAELLRSIAQKRELETLLADHILLRLKNVLITPHSAFNTREAVQRILDTTIENIRAFSRGTSLNVVSVL